MAMSLGNTTGDDEPPISDINTTPLVDVMLVLLIIFLITVPVVIQAVPVSLPKTVNEATTTKPENVNLAVRAAPDGSCEVYWNLTRVDSTQLVDRAVQHLEAEIARLGGPANVTELPEAHIRADVNTPYRCVGGTIFNMQRAGFARVGFISEPAPGSAATVRL